MKLCLAIGRRAGWVPALALLLGLGVNTAAYAQDEQKFPTALDAVHALRGAAEDGDTNELHAIFGPSAHGLVSADMVQAATERNHFIAEMKDKVSLVPESETRMQLRIGTNGWLFPIPLVQQNGQWYFDTAAGREEILNRRIGANELGAIRVCRAYVEAQREYASQDRMGDGVLQYAQHLRSTPGTHNGLYWSQRTGDELSPLGPLVAQARVEGYRHENKILTDEQKPYHGYYFKILTRQDKSAPGGKYDYLINGRMIAGFALVAWPAQWDDTGIMTFIVNQQGKVFQKNLGPKTDSIAPRMTSYDPGKGWTLVTDY